MADHLFDVREFLAHVESANAEELTDILARPKRKKRRRCGFISATSVTSACAAWL